MAKVIRHPSNPPEIREQVTGQRWVRTGISSTTAGLKQIKVGDVITNMFSGADAGRGAFYLHRLRLYGPQLTSDTDGSTPARFSVPSVVVNIPLKPLSTGNTFPFQRFTDQGMTGSNRACVAVEMPKFWQDFPLAHENADTIICELTNYVANAHYLLDLFVTLSYSPEGSTFSVVLM